MKRQILLLVALLVNTYSGLFAQNTNMQTYTMEHPYKVEKLKAPKDKKVKNVVLMIGDGMSLMDVYAAWVCNRGRLWLDNAQYIGLSATHCTDKLITDSGAGGTALATGHKTKYHAVGVDPEEKPLTIIIDLAKRKGKDAGIAVTCRLWDATPADFCCHNINRDNEQEIVADYPTSGVDFAFGGGAKYFTNRKDGRNIFEELKNQGYYIARTWEELEKRERGKVFCVPYEVDTPLPDERGDLLARATMKGISLMNQNKNGFFMMVEGSQLDDYGHFNQLDMLMKELHDFDCTIGEVMKWAAKDGETLVVITADHETGGLTLHGGDLATGRIEAKFASTGHTGVMVPVYAFGPGAEEFTGFMDNTEIFWKIKKLMRL